MESLMDKIVVVLKRLVKDFPQKMTTSLLSV